VRLEMLDPLGQHFRADGRKRNIAALPKIVPSRGFGS
jgi:hypothetical protein